MQPTLRRTLTAAGAATLISLTWGVGSAGAAQEAEPVTGPYPVSYTHLTLPTIYSV